MRGSREWRPSLPAALIPRSPDILGAEGTHKKSRCIFPALDSRNCPAICDFIHFLFFDPGGRPRRGFFVSATGFALCNLTCTADLKAHRASRSARIWSATGVGLFI